MAIKIRNTDKKIAFNSNYFLGINKSWNKSLEMLEWKEKADLGMEKEDKTKKQPMEFYNMSDFLRGQSSKLITGLSDEDRTAFVLKNGKPVAVLISHERYERLLKAGIDITEY